MPEPTLDVLLARLTGPEERRPTLTALAASLEDLSGRALAELLDAAQARWGLRSAAYVLGAPVHAIVARDRERFGAVLSATADIGLEATTRNLLLHVVRATAAEHGDEGLDRMAEGFAGVARQKRQPVINRAYALRSLALRPTKRTARAVLEAAEAATPALLNAAADVALAWRTEHLELASPIADRLARWAASAPEACVQSRQLLRLAARDRDRFGKAIHALREACDTPDLRDGFLAATGSELAPDLLARLVEDTLSVPTDRSEWLLRDLFLRHPGRATELAQAGHFETFLRLAERVPAAVSSPGALRAFRALLVREDGSAVVRAAQKVYRQLFLRPSGWRHVDPPVLQGAGAEPLLQRVQTGAASGLQIGDAAYRLLDNLDVLPGGGVPTFGEHWHAGLFAGFEPSAADDGVFSMRGIQVDWLVAWDSEVVRFAGSAPGLRERDVDLVNALRDLTGAFVAGLENGTMPGTYRGARAPVGLSYADRSAIVATAESLVSEWITYCMFDMIQPRGLSFDGSGDDIFALRCDGMVEYVYERNGIRVMDGRDSAEWDISEHPSNHNRFHGHLLGTACTSDNYTAGDTCPRSQAGDVGGDTTFVTPPARIPQLRGLGSGRWCAYHRLAFTVEAECSRYVYVRVLVARGAGEPFIVESEDPTGQGEAVSGFPEGAWALRRVDLDATGGEVVLMWKGRTTDRPARTVFTPAPTETPAVPGPDYDGQDGDYTFTVQCVDQGGNVSDAWALRTSVDWL